MSSMEIERKTILGLSVQGRNYCKTIRTCPGFVHKNHVEAHGFCSTKSGQDIHVIYDIPTLDA